MKKIIIALPLFLFSCVSSKKRFSTPADAPSDELEGVLSAAEVIEAAEAPLYASPDTSAWVIFVILGGFVALICLVAKYDAVIAYGRRAARFLKEKVCPCCGSWWEKFRQWFKKLDKKE